MTQSPPPRDSAYPANSDPQETVARLDRDLLELLIARFGESAEKASPPVGLDAVHSAIDAVVASTELPAGLPAAGVRDWLRHAASLCRPPASDCRIAYLGPPFSYSYLATVQYFGQAADLAPVQSIESVFESVDNGDCFAGVVPIENSTDGRIVDTLGMFVKYRVNIRGEVLLPIHHNLLARAPREAIQEVCSKPQALSQCRQWLARHLPTARLVEVASTTEAARRAAEHPGVAAVASAEAGRQYGLDVVDANIEDNRYNVTRFAVLGADQPAPTGHDKTTLVMQLRHQPGALADAMAIFKSKRLNLTWIESFPIPGQHAEYYFFLECEGHREDAAVAAAVDQLATQTQRLDVLGSYPIGSK